MMDSSGQLPQMGGSNAVSPERRQPGNTGSHKNPEVKQARAPAEAGVGVDTFLFSKMLNIKNWRIKMKCTIQCVRHIRNVGSVNLYLASLVFLAKTSHVTTSPLVTPVFWFTSWQE